MSGQEIAVIGMAGRFPGAPSIDAFWQNLKEGAESISDIPEFDLRARGVSPTELADPAYVRAAAVLDGVDQFDAGFFGFSPRDASIMDPQHRHFLECAWEALENAGYTPEQFAGRVGVYAGSGLSSYLIHNLLANPKLVQSAGFFLLRQTGNDKDVLATRVSYQLNLHGPSINVQTACSTSLVAIHMACQSLLSQECDMALAGGVTIEIPHGVGYLHREGEILSKDGHCRSFDARSSGTVFGSGLGIVVLRRLEDAIADGDYIHAIVLGSAVNNDGARKVGYLAPSVDGQSEVIAEVLALAGVDPLSIAYIETHGTGTKVGDPIEIKALTQAFREFTPAKQFCAVGSVKSNIGHLDTAAGVAGFIKAVLALEHRQIPASLHFDTPNPHIDFANSPFYVNARLRQWTSDGGPRRAGVTSLGIGGTNTHVLLEEAPPLDRPRNSRAWQLLTLSARSAAALDKAAGDWAECLEEHPELDLADVSFTSQLGRKAFEHRRAVVCRSREDAIGALRIPARPEGASVASPGREVVFLFSGQGSQYINMGLDLFRDEPLFREQIDLCAELLKPHMGVDLRTFLYPSGGDQEEARQKLAETWITQPALFTVEYALAKLWMSWGVTPRAMIGHSIGEYVAACLAGVFSLDAALAIVAERGRLMQTLPPGAMTAVALSLDELLPLLPADVSIAAINGPRQCVASGTPKAIEQLEQELATREIWYRRLQTSRAFHSGMTEPVVRPFTDFVRRFAVNTPAIPYVSNVTATWVTAAEVHDPDYWGRHLCGPVRFTNSLDEIFRRHEHILLEVGPGQTLSALARQHPGKGVGHVLVRSMRTPDEQVSDTEMLLAALGQLWTTGVRVNWDAFRVNDRGYRVPLPTYPFERQRYWIEPEEREKGVSRNTLATKELGGQFYREIWKRSAQPKLGESTPKLEWLVFSDRSLEPSISKRLRSMGHEVTTVQPGRRFSKNNRGYTICPDKRDDYDDLIVDLVSKGKSPSRILHLWPLDTDSGTDSLARAQESGFYSLLFLAQSLGERGVSDLHLTAVSDRMQAIAGERVVHPESATLLGPCKVIPKEFPGITTCSIDISLAEKDHDRIAQQIIDEVASAASLGAVAFRGDDRWVEFFDPVTLADDSRKAALRDGGVYLITGGIGGIGLKVAARLAKEAHARLILTSRTPFLPRENWDEHLRSQGGDPVSRKIRTILEIEKDGAQVLVVRAHAADEQEMRAVIEQARDRFGAIHGVIHAAGVLDDGPIQFKTAERARAVLEPKLNGTLVLHKLLKDADLDFFALFSSISSVVAPAGQVDYVAANAFLDAFARAQSASRRMISINWPLWRGVGMAATEAGRVALSQPHPLLTTRANDASGVSFAGELAPKTHWILSQHSFHEGKALFPGTGYLEMVAEAMNSGGATSPLELRDVLFTAPFAFDADQTREVRVRITKRNQGGSRFSVVSRGENGEWQEYAQGTAGEPKAGAPARFSLTQVLSRCHIREADFRDRPLKQEKHIFFGPRWRSLQRIHFGNEEAVAISELPPEFRDDLKEYRIHPALFDIATGSALYLIRNYESADDLYLPLGYNKITIWGRLPARVYSYIRMVGENAGAREVSTFDIVIADDGGTALIEIEGFSLRRITGQQIDAFRKGAHTHASASQPPAELPVDEGISALEGEEALLRILASSDQGPSIALSTVELNAVRTATGSETPQARNAGGAPVVAVETAGDGKDGIERTLSGWWQELLGINNPRPHDDFFELGGHSLIAAQLFAKLKKTYRVSLDLGLLFEARTIAKLAEAIRAAINQRTGLEPVAARKWSSLVEVQPSGALPPVYFVSGAGGHVLIFQTVAKYLGSDQPVYALQPPGLDGNLPFLTRMEDIARHYINEIKAVQPTGPYYLAGYSFGGVVTFEMAQQLIAGGDKVGMLILLDTTWRYWEESKGYLSFGAKLKHYGKRIVDLFKTPDELADIIGLRTHWALRKIFRAVGRPLPGGTIEDANWFAVSNYEAKPYPGWITVIRCSEQPRDGGDELLGWRDLAAGVHVKDTPGNHMTIVKEPNVRQLSATLRQCLVDAQVGTATPISISVETSA